MSGSVGCPWLKMSVEQRVAAGSERLQTAEREKDIGGLYAR